MPLGSLVCSGTAVGVFDKMADAVCQDEHAILLGEREGGALAGIG